MRLAEVIQFVLNVIRNLRSSYFIVYGCDFLINLLTILLLIFLVDRLLEVQAIVGGLLLVFLEIILLHFFAQQFLGHEAGRL